MAETQEAPQNTQFSVRSLAQDNAFFALTAPDKRAVFLHRAQNDPEFKQVFPDKQSWENVFEELLTESARRRPLEQRPQTAVAEESLVLGLQDDSAFLAADTPTRDRLIHEAATQEENIPALVQRYALLSEEQKASIRDRLIALPRIQAGREPQPYESIPQKLAGLGTAIGRGAVKGADVLAGLPAGMASLGTHAPVFTPQGYKSLQEIAPGEPTSVEKQQMEAAGRPLETVVAGKEGFSPLTPGYRAIESIVSGAVSSALVAPVMTAIFPIIASGVPLSSYVLSEAGLGAFGAGAAEAVKAGGGGPWAQAATELTTSVLTPKEWVRLIKSFRTHERTLNKVAEIAQLRPELAAAYQQGRRIEDVTGATLSTPELLDSPLLASGYQYLKSGSISPEFSEAATTFEQAKRTRMGEAVERQFGGPPQEDVLRQVVEGKQAPVTQARTTLESAQTAEEFAAAGVQAEKRAGLDLRTQRFYDLQTAEDATFARLQDIQRRKHILEDVARMGGIEDAQALRDVQRAERRLRQEAADRMVARLDELRDEQRLLEKQAKTEGRAVDEQIFDLRKERDITIEAGKKRLITYLDDLQQEKDKVTDLAQGGRRDAQIRLEEINADKTKALQDYDRIFNEYVKKDHTLSRVYSQAVRDLDDELSRTSALNQQDMERVTSYASFDAMKKSPLSTLPPGQRQQTGFEKLTELGEETGSRFYRTVRERTDKVAKVKYEEFFKRFSDELEGSYTSLEKSLDVFEQRIALQARESYIPDPVLNDIRYDIYVKAKTQEYHALQMGTLLDAKGAPKQQMAQGTTLERHLASGKSLKDVDREILDNLQLNIRDAHDFRSRVLAAIRETPQDSPRTPILRRIYGITDSYMDSIAKKNAEAYTILRGGNDPVTKQPIKGLDKWYAQEIHRTTADPGRSVLRINPATGELFYPADALADILFSAGPIPPRTSKVRSKQLQDFLTHMRNIDETIVEGGLRGDHDLVAQAENAKKAVLDIAKTKFYLAAHDPITGAFSPDKAQKWLSDYGTLIKNNPDLFKIFKTTQTRLDAIREVQAITEGRMTDLEEYQRQLVRARQLTQETTAGDIFEARQTRLAGRQQAEQTAVAQRSELARQGFEAEQGFTEQERTLRGETTEARRGFAQETQAARQRYTDEQHRLILEKQTKGDVLSGREQDIADEARRVRGEARGERQDITERGFEGRERLAQLRATREEGRVRGERALTAEQQRVRGELRQERRGLDELRLEHQRRLAQSEESSRVAREVREAAKQTYDAAIDEYKRTFQRSQAAMESLRHDEATQILGATPESIISEIEGMKPDARNRAYSKLFRGKDGVPHPPEVRQALYAQMWKNHLEKAGSESTYLERSILLPNPKAAATFIEEHRRLLQTFDPDYLTNLDLVQQGFQRIERLQSALASNTPDVLEKVRPERRHKIDFGVGATFGLMGFPFGIHIPYQAALAAVATDIAIRRHDARKIAVLRHIYLDPETTGLMARIFDVRTDPHIRQVVLSHILARTPHALDTATENPEIRFTPQTIGTQPAPTP